VSPYPWVGLGLEDVSHPDVADEFFRFILNSQEKEQFLKGLSSQN
jgi:hypothetical protein